MKLFNFKLKKLLFFLGERLRVFHQFILRCFHFHINFTIFYVCFHYWLHLFTSLFLQVFLFHHWVYYCFRVFSFHQLSLPWLFFVSYFVFVLLYRQCYGFERAFFTLRRFLPYTPSGHLAQPAFIKVSQGPAILPWI